METNYIDKLALIYIKDRKLLVTLNRGKDTWYIPGGKREANETDIQALLREIDEELCVTLIRDTINPYGVFEAQAHGKPPGTIVRMTCYTAEFTGTMRPGHEIVALDFFGYGERSKTSVVDNMIFDDLLARGLIE